MIFGEKDYPLCISISHGSVKAFECTSVLANPLYPAVVPGSSRSRTSKINESAGIFFVLELTGSSAVCRRA